MAKQAVKYETTTVDAGKTVGEITALLREYGDTRFEQIWDPQQRVTGIRFGLRVEGWGELPVRMEIDTAEIERLLRVAHRSWGERKRKEQAYRIAWRHTKDFLEQALLRIKLGLVPAMDGFFGDVETTDPETEEPITLAALFGRRAVLDDSGRIALNLPAAAGRVRLLIPSKTGDAQ